MSTATSWDSGTPRAIVDAFAELCRSHRCRVLTPPNLTPEGDYAFSVLLGPQHDVVGSQAEEWFEVLFRCPRDFPFQPLHAVPVTPPLKWHPHQNGHGAEYKAVADIMCPPQVFSRSFLPYAAHYRAWIEDAIKGTLTKPFERFEIPHVAFNGDPQLRIYVDGGLPTLDWISEHKFGVATVKPISFLTREKVSAYAVTSLFGSGTDPFDMHFNHELLKTNAEASWVPWAFLGNPVAGVPHRPHLQWADFNAANPGRIEKSLSEWYGFESGKR